MRKLSRHIGRRRWILGGAAALAGGWLLAFSPPSAQAQLPRPRLAWLFPPGAPAGSTNDVGIGGSDLDEPRTIVFSDPRVTAQPRADAPGKFTLVVPAGVPAGPIEARFSGRFGWSNPRVFLVGRGLERVAPTPQATPETAMALPRDTVINSRVQAGAASWHRFSVHRGERLLVQAQARELDSPLVTDLAVFDADGRELAIARRSALLDFTAGADGEFLVRVSDQTFRGGDEYVYRLLVTAGPHVDFALPNTLQAGRSQRVTLLGRNLPGGRPGAHRGTDGTPLEELEVDLPSPDPGDGRLPPFELLRRPAAVPLAGETMAWTFPAPDGTGARLLFARSPHPVARSLTPGLVAVQPPVEFSAFFPGPRETGGVRFRARKGDVWWIELTAERLGFVVDPWAIVQRVARDDHGAERLADIVELKDTEANLGGREFDTSTRDAAARFEASEDGEYQVVVRDLFNRQSEGRRLPYRLTLRPETPDFQLAVLPSPPPRLNDNDRQIHLWTTVLRRGETTPVRVIAFRQDGFDEPIEVTAANLPAGVTTPGIRIPAGQSAASLLLTATGDAPGGATAVRLTGHARSGTRDLARPAAAATAVWSIADWDRERGNARATAELPVAVCAEETAPVVLTPPETAPPPVAVGGKLPVPVIVGRQPDFPAAFNVKWYGHPEVEKLKELAVGEKATNAVFELDLAGAKLPAGTHTLWLQGLVTGKYRNNPDALAAAETALRTAEESVKTASPADQPAAEERRKAAEAARQAAAERAKPRDVTVAVYSPPIVITVTNAPAANPPKT